MDKHGWRKNDELFIVPDMIYEKVFETQGRFFEQITNIDPIKITNDLLDPQKALQQASILQEFIGFQKGGRVLEVGAGLGINLGVWIKRFEIDGYGVEPSGAGFDNSLSIARNLFALNSLEPNRLLHGCGESLPFRNNTFDVVFSANVLEHTRLPEGVISEGIRVLKPGGVLQVVYPNYHSFFEGHYAIFHPPVFSRWFLPLYIKFVARRDPSFSKTLRTELNVNWTKCALKKLQRNFSFSVLSLGEEIFSRRMKNMNFSEWAGLSRVKNTLRIVRTIRVQTLLSFCMVKMKLWTPIILTLRKDGEF